jgi:hypothetical protein
MDAVIEAIKDCLERRVDIGAKIEEPSAWDMILAYYTSHGIELDEARGLADQVQCGLARKIAERLRVSA